MGIEWSGFDDLEADLRRQVNRATEEGLAEQLAEHARTNGLSDVSTIELTLTGDEELTIDKARVRTLADEILARDA